MSKHFIIWGLLIMALSSCTNKGNFTKSDLGIINECDSIMRVLTVDKPADNKVLRKPSRCLTDKALRSEDFARLSQLMLATVTHPSQDGVGIAAPQVGLNKRVIAVQRFDKKRKLKNGETEFPFEVYANIRIVSASDEVELGGEGCLSVPGRNGDVLRSKEITIEYTDYSSKNVGKKLPVVRETVKGFTAVIFQHEIDHLEGVLYIDRL